MRFETMVTVDAPPDVVWEVLSDVESWPQITESMTSVKVVEEGPLRIGSHVKIKQPKLAPTDWTVTELVEDELRRFTWVSSSMGVRSTGVHDVTTQNGTTHLRLELDQTGLLAGVVGLLAGGLIRRYMGMEEQGIKKRAEERA